MWGTHWTPLRNTDAKCPSALQVSGMMAEGRLIPESVEMPLSANERVLATTSPVVVFNKSSLRPTQDFSVLS